MSLVALAERWVAPPITPLRAVADGGRLAGLGSVVVGVVAFTGLEVAVFALALLGLCLARLLTAGLDLATVLTVHVAAWSSVLGLYTTVWWLDLAVHALLTGLLAVLARVLLARLLPPVVRAGEVVLVTALGLALAALWEVGEYAGFTLVSPDVHVGYADTIGDVVAGGLGALAAALARRPRGAAAAEGLGRDRLGARS